MRSHVDNRSRQGRPTAGSGGTARFRRMAGRVAVLTVAVMALFGASLALAEEITRDEYRARVEPICQRNAEANKQILKGVRAQVKRGELTKAARRLMRAAAALHHALVQLKAVPRPVADEALLKKWFKYVGEEVALLEQTGRALKAGKRNLAVRYQTRLIAGAERANNTVVAFEFHYCRFQPSKYL